MSKRIFINNPVPRVGVKADASKITLDELCNALDSSVSNYATYLWESCYFFSSLYHRPTEWMAGIKSPIVTVDHFIFFVQQRFPHRCYTRNDILTRVDVYDAYAKFNDPEIVDLIAQSGGLTKARKAVPWVMQHPQHVKEILRLCLENTVDDLIEQLRERFPLNGRKPSDTPPIEPSTTTRTSRVSGKKVMEFLGDLAYPMLDQRMFMPVSRPAGLGVEHARACLVQTYRDGKPDLSVDDVQAEKDAAWLDAMPARQRRDLLQETFNRWLHIVEQYGLGEADWPFGDVETRKAA